MKEITLTRQMKPILLFLACIFITMSVKPVAPGPGSDATTITFHLQRGSSLYVSYPINHVQVKEILLDKVTKDSSFALTIHTALPFMLFSMNRSYTSYLFYPGTAYSAQIKSGETTIDFECQDKLKEKACNSLRELEAATLPFGLGFKEQLNHNL
ncbi:hypothetical protein [Chitinophaga sp. Cy-1792]|uniref:hypothetical protein n=1 Tax=Chitinophaga sp. Cy-1792 TaxID=2608339 RepID=UPI001420483B|nr:hypothetical protein [Chitinophaga sp. Cy-1792]NIG54988.1 hypothetical protein [Chitinophaga sp. Cy-1792]